MTETNEIVVTPVEKKAALIDILKFKLQGLSDREIGEKYHITSQAINKRLQGIFKLLEPDKLQAYKENKANLLSAIERELLNILLQPDKMKKASLMQIAASYGIIYDKNRLEAGLSTQVIDIGSELQALAQGRQVLIDRLARLEGAEAIIIDDKGGKDDATK